MRAPGAVPVRSTASVAWALLRTEPRAYLAALCFWICFHSAPVPIGLVLKAVLDRVGGDAGTVSVWAVLGLLAAAELGRWTEFVFAIRQFSGMWAGLLTVPRLTLLRSLAAGKGPVAGRLPSSSGEAVSRFRDDTESIAQVCDVWLDIAGSGISTVLAVAILASVDARLTFFVVLPVLAALGVARWLGPTVRAWRAEAREAGAAVTAYLGDTFGAVLAVKVAGAEPAALERFREVNARRRVAARKDQTGIVLMESLSGLTGEIAVGLVLVVAAPALQRGDLTVGDVGLFAAYVSVLASLPRWTGRMGGHLRQADVSVRRLAELTEDGDPFSAVARPEAMDLRHGLPAPAHARAVEAPPAVLSVRGLTAGAAAGVRGVVDIDLDVRPGQLVAVTGPVGSGKSTLLRATLGLLGRDAGTVGWDGEILDDPGQVLVPPLVAYVPQVPRLFSETLADTILLGADPAHLFEAVALAQLDGDVAAMADGLDTMVGPRGVRLSGGQVQRAATARALVRRPALLVVDDLSSALDVETEARVWDALAGRTALVVTHRPQVLARADVVVRLDAGRRA